MFGCLLWLSAATVSEPSSWPTPGSSMEVPLTYSHVLIIRNMILVFQSLHNPHFILFQLQGGQNRYPWFNEETKIQEAV